MLDETLADTLNQSCHCIAVDPQKLQQSLEAGFEQAGFYARVREAYLGLARCDRAGLGRY